MAEVNLPEPKTRLEQYWKGIYDKASGGGGGGNPNYIETIEGTLANPFGDLDKREIIGKVFAKDASVFISFTFGDVTISMLQGIALNSSVLAFYNIETDAEDYIESVSMLCYSSGEYALIADYSAFDSAVFYNDQAKLKFIPSTLIIIHHPLPDSGT